MRTKGRKTQSNGGGGRLPSACLFSERGPPEALPRVMSPLLGGHLAACPPSPPGWGRRRLVRCSKAPPLPCPFPQPPADALRQDAVTPVGAGSPAWAGGFGNRQPSDAGVPGSTASPPPRPDPGHPDPHPAQGDPPRHIPARPQDPHSPKGPAELWGDPPWGSPNGARTGRSFGNKIL